MDELRRIYGDQFLCYVLACDNEALRLAQWSEEQNQVIGQLEALAAATAQRHPFERHLVIKSTLREWKEDAGMSLANVWRVMCGGALVEAVVDDDDCLRLLTQLARDAYPCLLVPHADESAFWMSQGLAVFGYPGHRDFCLAALADDKLKDLFPGAPDPATLTDDKKLNDVHSVLRFSSGRGGGFQLVTLAGVLLASAYDRTVLSGVVDGDTYLQKVANALQDARQLAVGRKVSIPAIIGLANVRLPEDLVITLPWGELRNVTRTDAVFVQSENEATVALATQVPFQILAKGSAQEVPDEKLLDDTERDYPKFEQWNNEIRRKIDLTRYALLLASQEPLYIGARHVSICVLDPLGFAPHRTRPLTSPMVAPEVVLDDEGVAAFKQWATRLKDHPNKLDVAMRRTLSAAADRLEPLDGFIDAVLAWENMFSGNPEAVLRTCGSIAVTLEPDNLEQRIALFKELKDLYRLRSDIVHGKKDEPPYREAIKSRGRAVGIAVEAMRRLCDVPGLLGKSSDERSNYILLGGLYELAYVEDDS